MTLKTHKTTVSVAALLAAMAISTPAFAQSADADVGSDTEVSVDAGDTGADASVSADGDADADTDDTDADADGDAAADVNVTSGDTDADASATTDASGNTTASTTANTTASAGGADTDVNGNARVSTIGDSTTRADAIANLSAAGNTASADLSGDIDDTNVSIVDVDDDLGADGSASLSAALDANTDGIADVQSAVQNNAELASVLENAGIDIEDVIGVQVAADGSVDVFVADGVFNADCGAVDFSADGMKADSAMIASATSATITALSDCEADAASDELTAMTGAVSENSELTSALQARGYTTGDVVGVTATSDTSVNIYVENE